MKSDQGTIPHWLTPILLWYVITWAKTLEQNTSYVIVKFLPPVMVVIIGYDLKVQVRLSVFVWNWIALKISSNSKPKGLVKRLITFTEFFFWNMELYYDMTLYCFSLFACTQNQLLCWSFGLKISIITQLNWKSSKILGKSP